MSETLAAIEDYTRLTILRLRGELPVDDRPRLDALEEQLRDQIDGARPAPRKIENPSAAPSRPTLNVKPAQVTVTRRGPGEEAPSTAPSIAPAPPPAVRAAPSRPASVAPAAVSAPPAPARAAPTSAPPRPEPPRVRSEPAPTLSALDKAKLNEIPARAVARTSYTPSVSPLFMDDYYESTLAPDHSLSGHDKATRVLTLGEETMALPEEARVLFGVADAPIVRGATPADPLRTLDGEEGELTELRGDGEETEAREPVFAPASGARTTPRDNSQTAIAPPPARPTPSPPRVSAGPARASVAAPAPPSRPAPAPAARPTAPASAAPPPPPPAAAPAPAPRTRPPEAPRPEARPITPIIVQLLSGETKRGELVAFDPDGGVVTLRATPQTGEESVDVNEVFAVFVGHARGVPPRPAEGTRIAVRMTNDREVVGVSPDYAPGANAMTLVPDDRRTVDRIWIPAWSVTEIRFA